MKKESIMFECSNCGAQYAKWVGRCLECGKWGSVEKSKIQNNKFQTNTKSKNQNTEYPVVETVKLKEIEGKKVERIKTNIDELDRVLGGGLVPGSLILLGGEPGIGKSTLALQLASIVPNTLYISGEESVEQIKLRADRLVIKSDTLKLGNATHVESIMATITNNGWLHSPLKPKRKGLWSPNAGSTESRESNEAPQSRLRSGTMEPANEGGNGELVIIDSIQTIYSNEVEGEAGNITQVRACTAKLMELAKSTGVIIVLIGQVTKEGSVAGPKTLEHLVDAVLYLEGDKYHQYRILRTAKNRFGSTDEIGVFSMEANGLQEVKNPSVAFLAGRGEPVSGSVVTCLIEGSRPMLLEIQALTGKTSFGYPQRRASGFELNRLQVLLGVLAKRTGLPVGQYDVFLNIVGGASAEEPAADLPVMLAVASALMDKALPKTMACFGEVGLGGEVRAVRDVSKRLEEIKKMGFEYAVMPQSVEPIKTTGLKIAHVKNVKELVEKIIVK